MDKTLFDSLIEQTCKELFTLSNLNDLTSNADRSMIENQLRNFIFFLTKSIESNNIKMVEKILPWMYHAYSSQGYKYEYFLIIYNIIENILKEFLDKKQYMHAQKIVKDIKLSHDKIIEKTHKSSCCNIQTPEQYKELQVKFKNALLNADSLSAKEIFNTNVKTFEDLFLFYGFVIYPAMVEVGIAWENGIISPAQEHLASAIVLEVLSLLYTQIDLPKITKGKVIVTTTTNEFHEIGAIMLSNLFEADGWDVNYLGCDTSYEDLLQNIEQDNPLIVALSVSMPFNLDNTSRIIKEIKNINTNIKVMVGGNAFNIIEIDEEEFGADVYLEDINEALKIANIWYNNEN